MLKTQQSGFIRLIILIIVVLVIAQLAGYGPLELWNQILWPIIKFGWKIILLIVNFLVDLLRDGYAKFVDLVKN